MAGHVFISYSRTNSPYVDELIPFLEAVGIPVWADRNLDYGDSWASVIRQQVDTCDVFMLVMTPEAEESPWVTREILRAELKGRPIIPLLLSGEPFFRLADLHHEDVRGGRMPTSNLIARLRKLTEGMAPAPPVARPQSDFQPGAATVLAPPVPAAAAQARVSVPGLSPGPPITFRKRNLGMRIVVPLVLGIIVFFISGVMIAAAGGDDDFASSTTVFAVIFGLAALVGSAIALGQLAQRRCLTVGAIGLTCGSGRWAVNYAWSEFDSAEIHSGKVMLVTVQSPLMLRLAHRPELLGRFDSQRGAFVVCDVAKVGATESQVLQAIALFAPTA